MLTDGRTDGQKNMFFLYYIDNPTYKIKIPVYYEWVLYPAKTFT